MKQEKSYDFLIKRVAQNIQKQRKKSQITQEGMTAHGFNYRHYQRIESGTYSMNLYTLYRLSKVFNTDITTFLKRTGSEPTGGHRGSRPKPGDFARKAEK